MTTASIDFFSGVAGKILDNKFKYLSKDIFLHI